MPSNTSLWLDPERVAGYLSVAYPDALVDVVTFACAAYVERFRAELDFAAPDALPEDLVQASVELASLEYQQRNAPSGFPGFGDTGDGFGFGGAYAGADIYRVSQIYRRLGIKNARTA
jgi:hypothetical protein